MGANFFSFSIHKINFLNIQETLEFFISTSTVHRMRYTNWKGGSEYSNFFKTKAIKHYLNKKNNTKSRIGRQQICPESVKAVNSQNKSFFFVMNEIGYIDIPICILHHIVNIPNWYAFIFKLRRFKSDRTQSLPTPFCSHFRKRIAYWRMQLRIVKSLRFLRTKSM